MTLLSPVKRARGCPLALLGSLALAATACHDVLVPPQDRAAGATAGDAAAAEGDAAHCAVALAMPADEGADHVIECTPVSYASRPPSSGHHYPEWPVFRVYSKPVPWGFLVHGLEHGAIVIVYNCPDGCPADLAAAQAMIDKVPPKEACSRSPVIMAPDPTLDVRFAASAWGYTLRAPCFDPGAFATFIAAHANQGPEKIPDDCGLIDREATGWCVADAL
jgi:hypothetical protein